MQKYLEDWIGPWLVKFEFVPWSRTNRFWRFPGFFWSGMKYFPGFGGHISKEKKERKEKRKKRNLCLF